MAQQTTSLPLPAAPRAGDANMIMWSEHDFTTTQAPDPGLEDAHETEENKENEDVNPHDRVSAPSPEKCAVDLSHAKALAEPLSKALLPTHPKMERRAVSAPPMRPRASAPAAPPEALARIQRVGRMAHKTRNTVMSTEEREAKEAKEAQLRLRKMVCDNERNRTKSQLPLSLPSRVWSDKPLTQPKSPPLQISKRFADRENSVCNSADADDASVAPSLLSLSTSVSRSTTKSVHQQPEARRTKAQVHERRAVTAIRARPTSIVTSKPVTDLPSQTTSSACNNQTHVSDATEVRARTATRARPLLNTTPAKSMRTLVSKPEPTLNTPIEARAQSAVKSRASFGRSIPNSSKCTPAKKIAEERSQTATRARPSTTSAHPQAPKQEPGHSRKPSTESRAQTAFRARPLPSSTHSRPHHDAPAPKPLTDPTGPRLRTEDRAVRRSAGYRA